MYIFDNLNQALIGMSKELIKKGVSRNTRGFDCFELPHPVLICINNPTDRCVTIPERKWNKILPFVESLWIALGSNDLDELPGNYVRNLYNFSDDGKTWRAGYGPRIRCFTASNIDYGHEQLKANYFKVDQLKFVIDSLKRDENSRQAIISIGDPPKDCYNNNGKLKETKDFPCTRSIHLQVNVNGELDCIVDIRSNDILWGFSAVNVFNFTFIQEYVANILRLPIGKYYHKADNFHFYDSFKGNIRTFSNIDMNLYQTDKKFEYRYQIYDLGHFDELVVELFAYERELRVYKNYYLHNFYNDMFNDWGKVFYYYHSKIPVSFLNPYLNKLFKCSDIDKSVYDLVFNANKDIVGVYNGRNINCYEVNSSVEGYISKCVSDGKKAIYLGKTNKFGKLNF